MSPWSFQGRGRDPGSSDPLSDESGYEDGECGDEAEADSRRHHEPDPAQRERFTALRLSYAKRAGGCAGRRRHVTAPERPQVGWPGSALGIGWAFAGRGFGGLRGFRHGSGGAGRGEASQAPPSTDGGRSFVGAGVRKNSAPGRWGELGGAAAGAVGPPGGGGHLRGPEFSRIPLRRRRGTG